jgi:hypothetical protein
MKDSYDDGRLRTRFYEKAEELWGKNPSSDGVNVSMREFYEKRTHNHYIGGSKKACLRDPA